MRCQAQWRRDFSGNRIGLDYTAVQVVIQMLEISHPKQVFKDICAMELAVLEIWANG